MNAVRLTLLWFVTILLTSCASASLSTDGDQPTASEVQPGSTPTRQVGQQAVSGSAAAAPPGADVPWSNRVDHEDWQAPLPPGEDGWPTEPPSRWPDLRLRLVLPPVASPGETVDYVVVLRNLAGTPLDLRPCGGYEQEVMGLGAGLAPTPVKGGTSTFRLNCDAEPVLGPGESRRYAMRIVMPRELIGDEALLRWGFVDNMPDYAAQEWIVLASGGK